MVQDIAASCGVPDADLDPLQQGHADVGNIMLLGNVGIASLATLACVGAKEVAQRSTCVNCNKKKQACIVSFTDAPSFDFSEKTLWWR